MKPVSYTHLHTQWLPERIMKVPLVRQLIEAGSISKFLTDYMGVEDNQDDRLKVIEQFVRIRSREDFPFWAATFVYIKAKGGGEDVLFRLTRPQRRFVDRLEKLRIAGKPIRIILLKACLLYTSQLYFHRHRNRLRYQGHSILSALNQLP